MRKILAFILSLAMIATLTPIASTATSTGRASNVKYYTDSAGIHTGIKSFDYRDDSGFTRNYFDVSDNEETTLDEAAIKKVLTTDVGGKGTLISKWGELGAAIMGSGSGIDKEYYSYVGKDSFKNDFSKGVSESGHKVKVNKYLGSTDTKSQGSVGDDCVRTTGLKNASSLNQVRDAAGQMFADVIDKKMATKSKALDRKDLDEALPELKDSTKTKAFYTLVGSMKEPSCNKRKVNVYGVCYYDFQVRPIADENLEMTHSAAGYDSIKEASEDPDTDVTYDGDTTRTVYTQENSTSLVADYGATTTNTRSETLSDTTSESYSYSSENQIGSQTSIRIGTDQSMVQGTETFSYDYTWGEAWESSSEHGIQKDNGSGSEQLTNVSMPPHTALTITHETTNAGYTLPYNSPVEVMYKVVIFNLSGDIYADNTSIYYNNTSEYRTADTTIFFGSDDSSEGTGAADNLEMRWNSYNKGISGYDDAHSDCYRYYHKGTSETQTSDEGLDWEKVSTGSCNGDITDAIENLCYVRPTLAKGSTLSKTCELNTSKIEDLEALYPIEKVVINDSEHANGYYLIAGSGMNLPQGKIHAEDYDGEYYDFSESMGHWEIQSGADVVELNNDYDKTGKKPTIVIGKQNGTATLEWVFDDPDMIFESSGDDVRAGDIKIMPAIMINVVNSSIISSSSARNKAVITTSDDQTVSDIQLKSTGKEAVASDEPVFIEELVEMTGSIAGKKLPVGTVYDVSKKPTVPAGADPTEYDDSEWESAIDEAGMVTFSGPGTYKVSAAVGDKTYYTDITVGKERELASVSFVKKKLIISSGSSLNISSFLVLSDQYGKQWTMNEWKNAKGANDLKFTFKIKGPTKEVEVTRQTAVEYMNDVQKAYFTPQFVPGNYTVSVYKDGNKLDTVTIKAKQRPGTKVKSLKAGKGKVKVTLARQNNKVDSKHISGYQVQYSLKKDMSEAKTINLKGYRNTVTTIKGLKSKSRYYVKARSYMEYKGLNTYSQWSAVKSVKTR